MLRDHWDEDICPAIHTAIQHLSQARRRVVDSLILLENQGYEDSLCCQRLRETERLIDSLRHTLKEDPCDGGEAHVRAFDNLLLDVLDAHPDKDREDLQKGLTWFN